MSFREMYHSQMKEHKMTLDHTTQQEMPRNPENIFVAMLALLAFASPSQADLINYTYWAYIPNPPFIADYNTDRHKTSHIH